MSKQISFIGRQTELQQLTTLVKTPQITKQIVCITGAEGIGKSRLLQEIQYQFRNNHVIIPRIIDFDNFIFRSPQKFGPIMAQLLGRDKFKAYTWGLADLRRMEQGGVSQKRLQKEMVTINHSFAKCFNLISEKQPIILLMDTTDALEGKTDLWNYITKIYPVLENCAFVIAGRDAKTVGHFFRKTLQPPPIVSNINLQPLDSTASKTYLKQKEEYLRIIFHADMEEKLLLLAQGLPILIDMATEWITRNIPLQWLQNLSLEALKQLSAEEKKKYQQEFECQLVRHIADLRTPIDRLILEMAHTYPVDNSMVSELLMLSSSEAKELFELAKTYVFVKVLPDGKITLHDKMRTLVQTHVWPLIDPEGDRRIRGSQKAVTYFKQTATQAAEKIKQSGGDADNIIDLEHEYEFMTQQWIFHALQADFKSGFNLYLNEVKKARKNKQYRFAIQLAELVEPYRHILNSNQSYESKILQGRLLTDVGETDKGIKIFKDLLAENLNNQLIDETNESYLIREADIYNAWAVGEVQRGQLKEALHHQKACLKILTKLEAEKPIPTVSNYLGYIHRLRGQWQEAITYYKQAFDLALKNNAFSTAASSSNNLGFVSGLSGDYDNAISHCEQAIKIWQNQGREILIGQGESTLGSIYGYKGDYEKAEQHILKAIERFKTFDAKSRLVEAYYRLGVVYAIKGIEQKNTDDLELAKDYFQESVAFATKNQFLKELPKIFLEGSLVFWALGRKKQAYTWNERALEYGQEMDEIHSVVGSLVNETEYDCDEEKYNDMPIYLQKLKNNYEDKGYFYPLLSGRMRRIQAVAAFNQQNYEQALNYYVEALPMIATHGGYGKYKLNNELLALEKNLLKLPPKTAETWSITLKEQWTAKPPAKNLAQLINWCDGQIVQAKLRALEKG